MIKTAIVLAGGFGTRLQAVVKDVPKPMAPVAGKPFLEYLLIYLQHQGITKSILSVGYKWETIRNYFGDAFGEMKLEYSVEDEPLGTGGAIKKAVDSSDESAFFIFNGDSFFNIDLRDFEMRGETQNAPLSIALKAMKNFDRYGVVKTDPNNRIISFEEKKFYEQGNINGGVYLLRKSIFNGLELPQKFSFEKDLMEKHFAGISFTAFSFNDYFIDIGIPEDYNRSQVELPLVVSKRFPFQIDKGWTLFLDRDGVLNKKIDNDYVRNLTQFDWLNGVQDSLVLLSKIFGRIIIVSNQQGVGKGLMTSEDVENIHKQIIKTISQQGGRIDRIYFAPQLKQENSPMRKPGIGMALQAKKDFPEIDFSKSIMVGDSMSDMEFGKKAGMKTVFIPHGKQVAKSELIDSVSLDLKDFAQSLSSGL